MSCRVSCGRQGRRWWVGRIPHIFTQPPRAVLCFGAWSRKLICVTVIYAKETSGVFAFYGAVFVPQLFAPFHSPVHQAERTPLVRGRLEVKERETDGLHTIEGHKVKCPLCFRSRSQKVSLVGSLPCHGGISRNLACNVRSHP